MADPTISIIIPTAGDNPLLDECLASIKKLHYPPEQIQTVVITNQDLHKAGKEFSFAASVNHAARKAKGAYLYITNDDIVLRPDTVRAWVDAVREFPNTILGAKIRDKDTNKPLAPGYTMSLWTGIAKPVFTSNIPTPCDWVSGCALFLSRRIWNKLKGFDEGFAPGYFEDFDLCLRAKKARVNCLLWPSAEVLHAETTTFNRNKPKKYEYWYRNKIRFLTKQASPLQLATALTLQYALFTPARAIVKRDGRLLPALKGLHWNIRQLSNTLASRRKMRT
ncbi:glycosyltransferase family 2 protein [Patescibacteria group bacterium]|nr:glycosyltransferase family 2 protein [Patescibacteria group bacterium]